MKVKLKSTKKSYDEVDENFAAFQAANGRGDESEQCVFQKQAAKTFAEPQNYRHQQQ